MGQLLSEVYCRIQLSVSLSFCSYLLSILENQQRYEQDQMDQMIKQNFQQLRVVLLGRRPILRTCCRLPPPQGAKILFIFIDLNDDIVANIAMQMVHKYCRS